MHIATNDRCVETHLASCVWYLDRATGYVIYIYTIDWSLQGKQDGFAAYNHSAHGDFITLLEGDHIYMTAAVELRIWPISSKFFFLMSYFQG